MPLQACRTHEPNYKIIMTGLPRTEIVEDVLYVPETELAPRPDVWGIFRRDRRLVESTAFFRGPGPHLPYQNYTTKLDANDVTLIAPEQCYIYGGRVVPHFGHFLVGTLPRFWRQRELAASNLKILIHSPHEVATLFSHPHVAELFAAIGLSPQDFVRFTTPVRVTKMLVPWPSFEEGHLAFPVFADFCHEIGKTLVGESDLGCSARPVYFTKQNLPGGISRFANEGEFTKALADHDIDIVSPESLSVAEQLRVFATRGVISGSFGSVFHASIFIPRRRMIMLNWGDTMYRNFTLIDEINGNTTSYLYPGSDVGFSGTLEGFGANWELRDPEGLARQFVVALDVFSGGHDAMQSRNLSFCKPISQSSYGQQEGVTHSSGVDGRITAGATFHTEYERAPWWQVDLEQVALLTKVVLFNVVGPPIVTDRAAMLRLLVSHDGLEWSEVNRRTDPAPFGGIDGQPYVWKPLSSVTARFVRIQLLRPEFLHLDQVQVFGIPLTGSHAGGLSEA